LTSIDMLVIDAGLFARARSDARDPDEGRRGRARRVPAGRLTIARSVFNLAFAPAQRASNPLSRPAPDAASTQSRRSRLENLCVRSRSSGSSRRHAVTIAPARRRGQQRWPRWLRISPRPQVLLLRLSARLRAQKRFPAATRRAIGIARAASDVRLGVSSGIREAPQRRASFLTREAAL